MGEWSGKLLMERQAAQMMTVRGSPRSRRPSVGTDKAYDVRELFDNLRDLDVALRIAHNTGEFRDARFLWTTSRGIAQ